MGSGSVGCTGSVGTRISMGIYGGAGIDCIGCGIHGGRRGGWGRG